MNDGTQHQCCQFLSDLKQDSYSYMCGGETFALEVVIVEMFTVAAELNSQAYKTTKTPYYYSHETLSRNANASLTRHRSLHYNWHPIGWGILTGLL